MSDDDFTRHQGGKHQGPEAASPYALSRHAGPIDLVDVAREIQKADAMLTAVAGNKLRLLADQIRALQQQAREILEATQRDAEIHRAECAFQKRPGRVYHLYQKADGRMQLSMLSPQDWRGAPPHAFVGSYRLELDMSWTSLEKVRARDAQNAVALELLPSGASAGDE